MSLTNCPTCGEAWTTHGTACKTERLGSFAAPAGSTTPTQRERELRSIVRTILETPRNPARWEQWARVQLEKAEAGMAW